MVKIDKETMENNLPKENNKKEPSWQPKTDVKGKDGQANSD